MRRIFLLCWMAYFVSYLARHNFSSVMPALAREGVLGTEQAGFANTAYFLAYGSGQIVNGLLGDRTSPRWQIFVGMAGAAVCNFLMLLSSPAVMLICWCLNGYFQSMLWPSVIRVFAERLSGEQRTRAGVNIVSSMAAGSLGSYLLSALMLHFGSWRGAFVLPACLLMLAGALWLLCYRDGVPAAPGPQPSDAKKTAGGSARMLTCAAWLLFPVLVHGMLKDGVPAWVPTYLYERFGVSDAMATAVTMLLPVVNVLGAYMAGRANRRTPGKELQCASHFFLMSTATLALILLTGTKNVFMTGFLFALLTAFMMAVNTLLINLVPLHFRREGRVASLSGLLNAIAYFGSAAASSLVGFTVRTGGWNTAVCSWTGAALAAFIYCAALRRKQF